MDDIRFIFAGNRFYVLEEMLRLGAGLTKIFAVPGSWLEKTLIEKGIDYDPLPGKPDFVAELTTLSFDILVANGLPHILPVSRLQAESQKKFINVHPSCLPDLRGADPQPAALLFGRDSGATCHYMNDHIDAGDIISKVKIDYSETFDAGLLYQLTFRAEKEVFNQAWEKEFIPMPPSGQEPGSLYYSFRKKDLQLNFGVPAREILRRIKAFNTPNKVARFTYDACEWLVGDATLLHNRYMKDTFRDAVENEIVLSYQDNIVIKKRDGFLVLKHVKSSGDTRLRSGQILRNEWHNQDAENEVD